MFCHHVEGRHEASAEKVVGSARLGTRLAGLDWLDSAARDCFLKNYYKRCDVLFYKRCISVRSYNIIIFTKITVHVVSCSLLHLSSVFYLNKVTYCLEYINISSIMEDRRLAFAQSSSAVAMDVVESDDADGVEGGVFSMARSSNNMGSYAGLGFVRAGSGSEGASSISSSQLGTSAEAASAGFAEKKVKAANAIAASVSLTTKTRDSWMVAPEDLSPSAAGTSRGGDAAETATDSMGFVGRRVDSMSTTNNIPPPSNVVDWRIPGRDVPRMIDALLDFTSPPPRINNKIPGIKAKRNAHPEKNVNKLAAQSLKQRLMMK